MVFVDPDLWAQGIGRQLLDAVSGLAADRGHQLLQLWPGQGNQRARRLYEGAGFRPSGRRQQLGGENVIHLVRPLQAEGLYGVRIFGGSSAAWPVHRA
ncbi:GNAT family N-acetyltransferase [Nonomuraea muscovyensis]